MVRYFIVRAKPSIFSVCPSRNFVVGPKDLPDTGINSQTNSGIRSLNPFFSFLNQIVILQIIWILED